MAVLTLVKEINGKDFIIGHVIETSDGKFWFNPNSSADGLAESCETIVKIAYPGGP